MVTTRRGTYPRGTYRFRPRQLVKRRKVVKRTIRRSTVTRKRPASMLGRGGSMTQTKRRRIYRDNNQYRQLETLTARKGRKNSSAVFMRKLIRSSYDYTKYLFRGYVYESGAGIGGGGAGDTGGRFYNIGLERPDANNTFYPVYLFNLTTIPQNVVGSGLINNGCAYRLRNNPSNSSISSINWFPVSSIDNSGASTGSPGFWQTFASTSASGSVGQAYPKCLMEYLNIKYTMRGPRARPTRFVVQVIQPYQWFQALPDNNSGYDTEQNTVWQSIANRNAANMCQNLPSTTRAPWRTLYTRVYEIQPTSSTETDVGGHDVHQRYFWKCNRPLNYMDQGSLSNYDTGDYADMNLGNAQGGKKLSCNAALGSQIYLLVQAYAPNGATAYSADIHPSFDLSVEKKVSCLGAGF